MEAIFGQLYRTVLAGRAPIIAPVDTRPMEGRKGNFIETTAIRSKYLPNFQTLAQFTGSKVDLMIGPKVDALKDVDGIEKVLAAMLLFGEYDVHAGNIGVMKQGNDFVAAKIDHGGSGAMWHSNANQLFADLKNVMKIYYKGAFELDMSKFKREIEACLALPENDVEKLVKAKIYELKRSGIKIKDLEFPVFQDNRGSHKTIKFQSFDEFEKYLIGKLHERGKSYKM